MLEHTFSARPYEKITRYTPLYEGHSCVLVLRARLGPCTSSRLISWIRMRRKEWGWERYKTETTCEVMASSRNPWKREEVKRKGQKKGRGTKNLFCFFLPSFFSHRADLLLDKPSYRGQTAFFYARAREEGIFLFSVFATSSKME